MILDDVPHNIERNAEVVVNDPITHAGHVPPGDLGMRGTRAVWRVWSEGCDRRANQNPAKRLRSLVDSVRTVRGDCGGLLPARTSGRSRELPEDRTIVLFSIAMYSASVMTVLLSGC